MGNRELSVARYWHIWGVGLSVVLLVHCSGAQRTIERDLREQTDAATQDVAPELDLSDVAAPDGKAEVTVCPVDWAKVPYTTIENDKPIAQGPTKFTRPFFTMCENGGFYWSDWQYFPDSIDPEQAQSVGTFVPCLSGECKWGICKEDAEFIEKRIKGTTMKGTVSVDGLCYPCNPNNAAYAVKEAPWNGGSCDSGTYCCPETGLLDGG